MAVGKGAAALAALAAVAVVASGRRAKASPGYTPTPGPPGGAEELQYILDAAGLPVGQQTFLLAVAWRESRFNSSAHNQRPSEVSKGRAGFDGAQSRGFYAGNPYAAEFRAFGSGGWFGFLPSTGMAGGGTDGPFRHSRPSTVMDPVSSIVMAADFIHRNQRYQAFRDSPTYRRMNLFWASLTTAKNPSSPRAQLADANLDEALEAIGVSPSFADQPLVPMTPYPGAVQMLAQLRAATA